jgi:undecaprenyl-diphosphatase
MFEALELTNSSHVSVPEYPSNFFNRQNTIILVGILTLWRLYLSAELQLHPDEAYYWLWSRNLDIGYFDHSPLVAYFIWLTTLFSASEFWIRLSGTVVSLILSYLIWQLSMQFFGSLRVAAGSVMLFNVYPLTMLGLIVITPDIPAFLFWSLSVYIFWQIMQSQRTWLWYVLGLTFGLALLSKYTTFLLAPCLLLYLVFTDDRRWLKTYYPYIALFIGFICFAPVVYWNSQHNWISFSFQLNHGLGGQGYSLERLAEYIAGQLLVAGPVVPIFGIYAAITIFSSKSKEQFFLLITAIPIILFFGFSSIRKLAGPNWPVFAYFTLSILITKYFLDGASKIKRSLWFAALFACLFISTIVTLHAKFSIIPLAKFSRELAVADPTNWFYGWRELAAELTRSPGKAFAVATSHQLSAEIIYYTNEKIFVQADAKVARPSQFSLWHWPNELQGKNGFYVWSEDNPAGPVGEYLTSTTGTDTLTIFRDDIPVRNYRIIAGQNSIIPLD